MHIVRVFFDNSILHMPYSLSTPASNIEDFNYVVAAKTRHNSEMNFHHKAA